LLRRLGGTAPNRLAFVSAVTPTDGEMAFVGALKMIQ
jgi:hypothetical protein